jgi:hypothetical protein
MSATKTAFVIAYQNELRARYEWANDEAKLLRFVKSVEATLRGPDNTWNRDGEAYVAALKSIGLSPRISLKALRELPQ